MFSRSVFTVFTAGLAALASAYTTPKGEPTGNPTSKPGLNDIVPVGKPYAITWNPTTAGTISILLLRGPSTNVVPIATIVEGIANTGTYEWTPSTSLEPDTTHYGIQLIVDGTGQYQYSPQFGISNPSYSSSSSSSSAVATSSSVAASSSKSAVVSAAATPCSTSTSVKASVWTANSTSYFVGTATGYSSHATATGTGASNHSIIYPTKSMTVPSSLLTTATAAGSSKAAASSAVATGAAGHVKAGLGLAGAIAGLVMAL